MTYKKLSTAQQGFTLIELLIVIGILAILLAITLFALNPTQHFQGARNAQRQSDVTAILDSVYEYEAANRGSVPPSVSYVSTATPLGGIASQTATATSFSNPNLTFTVPAGNIITSGTVVVSGCSQSADNGVPASSLSNPLTVTAGTSTSITVTNSNGVVTSATGCVISGWSGRVDICADVVPTYLAALPMDPSGSSGTSCTAPYNTGYTITKTNGRFTIAAPSAENGATISVTR